MFAVFSFFSPLRPRTLSSAAPAPRGRNARPWRPGYRVYCEPCDSFIFDVPRRTPKNLKRLRRSARILGNAGRS